LVHFYVSPPPLLLDPEMKKYVYCSSALALALRAYASCPTDSKHHRSTRVLTVMEIMPTVTVAS
jgi:hypothetical protein